MSVRSNPRSTACRRAPVTAGVSPALWPPPPPPGGGAAAGGARVGGGRPPASAPPAAPRGPGAGGGYVSIPPAAPRRPPPPSLESFGADPAACAENRSASAKSGRGSPHSSYLLLDP